MLCNQCQERDQCQTPCKAVKAILWRDNRVMERHFSDRIECLPMHGEVHFCELEDYQIERFSVDDVIPWSSEDRRLRKTIVFIERFFNKVPCKDLAERFGVRENTIVCMYRDAVEGIQKIVEAMDARREGLKATKSSRFKEDQKMFLLVAVFGFNSVEVAKMFNRDRKMVHKKVKQLSDKYRATFLGQGIKDE